MELTIGQKDAIIDALSDIMPAANRIAFIAGQMDYLDSKPYARDLSSTDSYAMGFEHRSALSELNGEWADLEMVNGHTVRLWHPLWGNNKGTP